ncbi:hypothetical protein DES53_12143 [Roseimicrobium gellanilyticum]|uniref:DUF2059 domain-containing protein n=1 Tax=Roseimicrobium gellanilyticum TaxID=748857 RepID=A0A366H2L9_9BACT|nr:DUF2059 domain-containing protein [Roseimicrobium gellanilyticum]RBP35523.1 hypothetical protein DES53_12143 [Roseimicrobium gellanilyticum]
MKILKTTFLAAFILPAALLHAEPSAENLAAAKKLADTINLKEQMDAGFAAMMPMVDQLSQQLKLDAAGKAELVQLYKDWFEKDLDQAKMMGNIVTLYAETFTVQELDGLRDFYQTPLGKKALKVLPEIMQKGAQLGMDEAKTKEQALMTRLNAFIEKHKPKN